jgi:hypothetical protein
MSAPPEPSTGRDDMKGGADGRSGDASDPDDPGRYQPPLGRARHVETVDAAQQGDLVRDRERSPSRRRVAYPPPLGGDR